MATNQLVILAEKDGEKGEREKHRNREQSTFRTFVNSFLASKTILLEISALICNISYDDCRYELPQLICCIWIKIIMSDIYIEREDPLCV